MGYMRHHAIVVTSWYSKKGGITFKGSASIEAAHKKAKELLMGSCPITAIVDARVNGYRSFLIAPDGSKEGWSDSEEGDKGRDRFVAWLRTSEADCLDWVFVAFPGDDDEPQIIGHKREEEED